jgi:hypothetical protein
MLRNFDKNKIATVTKMYAREIQALMESGFFRPLAKKIAIFNTTSLVEKASILINIDKILALGCQVSEKFQKAMKDGPDSLAAKDAVAVLREFVNILAPCDDTAFCNIGQAYLNDKEELDKKIPGLAEFVYEAISHVYP